MSKQQNIRNFINQKITAQKDRLITEIATSSGEKQSPNKSPGEVAAKKEKPNSGKKGVEI